MRLVEWYLGLPSASPGQGTDWGLTGEPAWSGMLPGWVGGLLVLAIIGGVISVYWRDAKSLAWPARTGLIGLRLASLVVLLVMLCRLTLTVTRTGMPTLALLIDTSASMGLEDGYSDEAAVKTVRRLAMENKNETSPSRLALAQSLLTRDDGRFLKQLTQTHRLKLFRFDATASPVAVSSQQDDGELTAIIEAIRALQPTGDETRPAAAVRQVLDDLRGSPPTALLVLTDGIPSTSDDDAITAAISAARDRSVPLIPIGFGSEKPVKDLQLYDVLADDVVFVDDPVTFTFQLKGFGYEDESTRVTLRQQGQPGVLQTVTVKIGRDGQPLAAELTHVPTQEGEFDYIIEATAPTDETNTQNNIARHQVQVRREQLRVLLVERLPRWEFRHLKPVLERDRAVELHTVLQQADVSFANEDRTALRRFPVGREELMAYDVIIWGDVDLSFLSPGALEHLQEFVAERGGGLVLIAGERHNPLSYRDTPLEDLLPVSIPEALSVRDASIAPTGFRPELTVEGRTRSALRLAGSAKENERLWRRLPPLYWLHESGRRKPAAQVLAVHPTQHGDGGRLPVIVMQRFGAGQVLFHATDELWQWRQRVEDRFYGRYWLQMIRYLSRSKLRSDARGIELLTDRNVYQQGEAVEVRARFLDPQSIPITDDGARAIVEGPGGRRESLTLTRLPEAPNLFTGRVSQLTAGSYHAWLAEPSPAVAVDGSETDAAAASSGVPSTDFRVEVSESELRDRVFRRADLVEAAKGSRGAYYPFWEAERFLEEVPKGRAVPVSSEMLVPLWNRWELLVLLTVLLSTEWITRKRAGLV